MNIPDIISYDKEGKVERFPLFRKLFLSVTIILVATLSFGIGRLSVIGNRGPVKIEYDQTLIPNSQIPTLSQSPTNDSQTNQSASVINAVGNNVVVTSKNGARYHYLHCSGAKQIKEENKIVFASPSAAEDAGYTLAANCKPK